MDTLPYDVTSMILSRAPCSLVRFAEVSKSCLGAVRFFTEKATPPKLPEGYPDYRRYCDYSEDCEHDAMLDSPVSMSRVEYLMRPYERDTKKSHIDNPDATALWWWFQYEIVFLKAAEDPEVLDRLMTVFPPSKYMPDPERSTKQELRKLENGRLIIERLEREGVKM
nr:hypothetical protein TetV2_00628 [Oceanusvirus sp.]